jgi:hypothetical protein
VFHRFPKALVIGVAYSFDVIRHVVIYIFAIEDGHSLVFPYTFHLYRRGWCESVSPIRFIMLE